MFILPNGLFGRTITLYRKEKSGIVRQVVDNCYLERKDVAETDLSGLRRERKFLLILPGDARIYPGDRVFEGIGPELGLDQWGGFIPVSVPELMEVAFAKACYVGDEVSHMEAGR